jgi:hypothetical protein
MGYRRMVGMSRRTNRCGHDNSAFEVREATSGSPLRSGVQGVFSQATTETLCFFQVTLQESRPIYP